MCKIPLLARRTRPSAARDDRVSCIQYSSMLCYTGSYDNHFESSLMMLVLVPTADVYDIFIQLVESIPDTVQIDHLLGYFESTYIAGLNGRSA